MTNLQRAQHWDNESEEWFRFVQSTKLTTSEFISAWRYMSLCDGYAEKNWKQHYKYNQ